MTDDKEPDGDDLTENEDHPLFDGFQVVRVKAGGFLIQTWCTQCGKYHPFDVAYDAPALFGVLEHSFFDKAEQSLPGEPVDDGSSSSMH